MQIDACPLIVGITGASGAALSRAFLEQAIAHTPWPLTVIPSRAARQVWREELPGEPFPQHPRITYLPPDALNARPASGSTPTRGMVVIPCSMCTLAKIAHGVSDNLIARAADVTIKEGRRLILAPREAPLSAIHLQNMADLARIGVTIMPPMLTLYHKPESIAEIVQAFSLRVLLLLGAAPPIRQWDPAQ